ncbi:hypothetical protein LAZ67_5001503 [Cordylochernes scorpioides]|uniref:Integrase catalytic domain-containing protein n=1 Tax=Cordylochernes scorpioides TaxID=51811 RepID=A0ABY6KGF5_9ARAC|nr:hypothetical protein LAZ67_5001503 [Cordylochernes scorpioides]
MSEDISKTTKACAICQSTKHPRGPTFGELGQLPVATQPFDLVALDTIAGLAKYGNAKTYLQVVVDHFSRYTWTFPSKSTSLTTYQQVIKRVLQDGSPKCLLTDRAPAFTSPKFRKFLINRNIHPLLTTSNNPQANGLCERLNATLTGKLRLLHLENPKAAWTKLAKRVTVVYNNTPHSVTGFPPGYLMFGVLPPELTEHVNPYPVLTTARRIAHERTQAKHLKDKHAYDQQHKTPHFEPGDLVLVKVYHHPNTGKLAPYFTGPYEILEIISPNVVRINRPNQPLNRNTDTVHVNKLQYYNENIRYIAPPTLIPHPAKPQSRTLPPLFEHLTPDLFTVERFAPTIGNCTTTTPVDPQCNIIAQRDIPQPAISRPTHITKVKTPIPTVRADPKPIPLQARFFRNVETFPLFHLLYLINLFILPTVLLPMATLLYVSVYTLQPNRLFQLQEALFEITIAVVELIHRTIGIILPELWTILVHSHALVALIGHLEQRGPHIPELNVLRDWDVRKLLPDQIYHHGRQRQGPIKGQAGSHMTQARGRGNQSSVDSYDRIIMNFGNMTDDEFMSSKVKQILLMEHERRTTREENSSKEVLQVNKYQNNSSTNKKRSMLMRRKYEKTKIKQEKSLATIALSISTEQQIHVIDCKTASEAWTTLEQIFEPKSRAGILQLKKQFVNIKFIEEENMINYLSRLKTCNSYDRIIMNFGNMTDDEFMSSKVKQILLMEHERRTTREENSSKEVLQVNKYQNNSSTNSRRKCYRCVMADRIAELNPNTEIYEAAKPENETKMLLKKIESLEQKIESMKMERHGRSRDRRSRDYHYNARSRSRSKGGYNPKGKFCYFHYRYGKNCLPGKCKKPCEWFNAGKLQPALYAANGTEISTYGTQILSLDLGLRRQFQWPFVIAKTNRGILGADFLNNFKLILDINRRQLIDGITNLTIKGDICSISEETFSSYRTTSNLSKLLANYPDIMRPNVGIMKANHDVKHFIITKGPPVFSRARPLDPKRLNEAKQEFQFMLEHEIIRPSKSQWASPLHLVTKKDGTLRPCGDYRKLNSQTFPDRYPIPRLEDFQHILSGKMIFSRLDLFKAYFQIPIAEEDKPKTAIITPFGLYEFNVMSFGLRNAPATFQRFIHEVQTILDYKLPTTKRELRTFLGMVNFYRRYLENAASTQALLHDYLKDSKKNDKRKIDWSEEAKLQFERCKQDLASAALLCYPNPALPLSLCTDASNNAIGSVLQQCENSCWKPIAFFSKKLNNAQKVYSTYDRELLGIYLSIKKFKYMLEGREFYIFTDHKPLVYAFKQNNEKASPRQQRQLQYISQFSTDIRHISGDPIIPASREDPIIPASRENPIGPSSKPQPSKPKVRFELPKETRSGRRIKPPSRYNESIGRDFRHWKGSDVGDISSLSSHEDYDGEVELIALINQDMFAIKRLIDKALTIKDNPPQSLRIPEKSRKNNYQQPALLHSRQWRDRGTTTILIHQLPTRIDIKVGGETILAFLFHGIRCNKCHKLGQHRVNCPQNPKAAAEPKAPSPQKSTASIGSMRTWLPAPAPMPPAHDTTAATSIPVVHAPVLPAQATPATIVTDKVLTENRESLAAIDNLQTLGLERETLLTAFTMNGKLDSLLETSNSEQKKAIDILATRLMALLGDTSCTLYKKLSRARTSAKQQQ